VTSSNSTGRRSSRSASAPSAARSRHRRTGWERAKNVSRVASFLIDPQDGRLPALTPEAQKAQLARAAAQQERRRQLNGIEADWTTDRSNYDRCISLGVQGSLTPKNLQLGQPHRAGPRLAGLQQRDDSRDARHPDRRPQERRRRRSSRGWATRSATGRATRWLSRPAI
jgi:hypothetical protein